MPPGGNSGSTVGNFLLAPGICAGSSLISGINGRIYNPPSLKRSKSLSLPPKCALPVELSVIDELPLPTNSETNALPLPESHTTQPNEDSRATINNNEVAVSDQSEPEAGTLPSEPEESSTTPYDYVTPEIQATADGLGSNDVTSDVKSGLTPELMVDGPPECFKTIENDTEGRQRSPISDQLGNDLNTSDDAIEPNGMTISTDSLNELSGQPPFDAVTPSPQLTTSEMQPLQVECKSGDVDMLSLSPDSVIGSPNRDRRLPEDDRLGDTEAQGETVSVLGQDVKPAFNPSFNESEVANDDGLPGSQSPATPASTGESPRSNIMEYLQDRGRLQETTTSLDQISNASTVGSDAESGFASNLSPAVSPPGKSEPEPNAQGRDLGDSEQDYRCPMGVTTTPDLDRLTPDSLDRSHNEQELSPLIRDANQTAGKGDTSITDTKGQMDNDVLKGPTVNGHGHDHHQDEDHTEHSREQDDEFIPEPKIFKPLYDADADKVPGEVEGSGMQDQEESTPGAKTLTSANEKDAEILSNRDMTGTVDTTKNGTDDTETNHCVETKNRPPRLAEPSCMSREPSPSASCQKPPPRTKPKWIPPSVVSRRGSCGAGGGGGANGPPVLITGGKIVNGDITITTDIYCDKGQIWHVGEVDRDGIPEETIVIDASGKLIFPGGVDFVVSQTPYRSAHISSEDLAKRSKAAVSAGITCLVETVVPQYDESLLEAYSRWRQLADQNVFCNYALVMTVTVWNSRTKNDMSHLVKEYGLNAFSFFVCQSPSYRPLSANQYMQALRHCNDLGALAILQTFSPSPGLPEGSLTTEINKFLAMATISGCKTIVFPTTPDLIGSIDPLRQAGYPIHAGTSIDILTAKADHSFNVPWLEYDASQSCNELLLSLPRFPEFTCSNGLAVSHIIDYFSGSLEFLGTNVGQLADPDCLSGRLALLWSHALENGFADISKLSSLTSGGLVRLLGLNLCKGRVDMGYDADLVIWEPPAPDSPPSKSDKLLAYPHKPQPSGSIVTVMGGKIVVQNGKLVVKKKAGEFIILPPRICELAGVITRPDQWSNPNFGTCAQCHCHTSGIHVSLVCSVPLDQTFGKEELEIDDYISRNSHLF